MKTVGGRTGCILDSRSDGVGQMLLQKGMFNGGKIMSSAAVTEIEKGGDQEAFSRDPVASQLRIMNYEIRIVVEHGSLYES